MGDADNRTDGLFVDNSTDFWLSDNLTSDTSFERGDGDSLFAPDPDKGLSCLEFGF